MAAQSEPGWAADLHGAGRYIDRRPAMVGTVGSSTKIADSRALATRYGHQLSSLPPRSMLGYPAGKQRTPQSAGSLSIFYQRTADETRDLLNWQQGKPHLNGMQPSAYEDLGMHGYSPRMIAEEHYQRIPIFEKNRWLGQMMYSHNDAVFPHTQDKRPAWPRY